MYTYSRAYLELNKLTKAENYFLKAEELLEGVGREDVNAAHYRNGLEIYEKMGNIKKEYFYYKKWIETKQKIDRAKSDELLYTRENKNLSLNNQLLKNENQMKDIMFLLLIFLIAFLLIVFTLIYWSLKKSKLLQAEKLNTEIRTQSLHAQMKPHFLFNSLNSIMYLIHDSNKEASKATMMLSDLYRYILKGSKSYTWPLRDEIKLIQSYLELQLLKYEGRLSFLIDSGDVNTNLMRCPCLIMHTLVENSIKHAIALNPKGGTILISLNPLESGVKVKIKDSGPGADRQTVKNKIEQEKGTGTGLINTKRRLQNMYGEKSHFIANFSTEGSEIEFWISGKSLAKDDVSFEAKID